MRSPTISAVRRRIPTAMSVPTMSSPWPTSAPRSLTRPGLRSWVRSQTINSGPDLAALVRPRTPAIPLFIYDQLADRWLVSQFTAGAAPFFNCIAISQTADPTGAYFRYASSERWGEFPDYPKYGDLAECLLHQHPRVQRGDIHGCRSVCAEPCAVRRRQSRSDR